MVAFDFPLTTRPAQPRQLARTSDGDTPVIDQRSAWCRSTPPRSSTTPACHPPPRPHLTAAADGCRTAPTTPLPKDLRDYLIGRLTPDAAQRHIGAGLGASAAFEGLQEQRLTRPNGTRRRVAVIPTGEFIDRYGRLLAYLPRGLPVRRMIRCRPRTHRSGAPSTSTWSPPAGERSS